MALDRPTMRPAASGLGISSLLASVGHPLGTCVMRRSIAKKVRQFRRWTRLPAADRQAIARQQLCEAIERAGRDVPYYQELFRRLKFDPSKLRRDISYLRDLPNLTKQIIREQGARLISQRYKQSDLAARHTGASTGAATTIYYNTEALDWTAAAHRWARSLWGKYLVHREVHVSSAWPQPIPRRDQIKEWCKCIALNRINVCTDTLDEKGLDQLWENLGKARARLVQAHPSTMYALALHIEKQGVKLNRPLMALFESTGEQLDINKHRLIQRVIGCQVINQYGSAEFGTVAYTHPDDVRRLPAESKRSPNEPATAPAFPNPASDFGGLRVLTSMVLAQANTDLPSANGHDPSYKELVLTNLRNDAMPLIKYSTGDLVRINESQNAACLTHIDAIQGRIHDMVKIGDGVFPTHYIQDLLDRLGCVSEFQVQVRQHDRPSLHLVVGDQKKHAMIRKKVQQWWNDDIQVEFVSMPDMERRGQQNKFSYLISDSAE